MMKIYKYNFHILLLIGRLHRSSRIFLLVACLLAMTCMSAQTVNVDDILKKTSQIYEKWGGVHVKFSAHMRVEMSNTSESYEGTIRMKKDKFVLTAPDMTIWFDGTTQWTYMGSIEEVHVITPSDDDLRFINPMILLQNYKKDFNVSYVGESTTTRAKMAYDLVFTPQKKSNIEKVEIQIEKSSSLPAKLVVRMRNQVLSVTIDEMKADEPADEIFTFSKSSFPNAEVIDLR